jgi:hypothetical protein
MLPKYLKDSTFSSCFWSIVSFTGNNYKHKIYKSLLDLLAIVWLLRKLQGFQKSVLSVSVPDTQLVPDGGYATLHNISYYIAVSVDVE